MRLAVFAGVLIAFAALEAWLPARKRVLPRLGRWRTNLGLSVLGTLIGVLMAPVLAISVAVVAMDRGWGLFNLIDIAPWIELILAIILLDFAIWAQHVAFHHVPWLWRLHSVHHIDRDLDATTGIRFHPLEIGVSLLWKALVIIALGPAVIAVIIFEIALNATAIFTHSNISLPARLDRAMRRLIVTPDMHRIHHSVIRTETDSNFGFNLSIWDRLFRTYRTDPSRPLTLGLREHQDDSAARLTASLLLPFRRGTH